ncbi:signal peptide peptidase SppA [Pontibacter sp. JH31]|uniref:Signal peptide peptidase SppA n=1 Tax=Pontibacter aquaedesilientis TaxID=2766980 RepID=A0ABR7XHE4_9BACT|nr:signal peptide peptidase SppA [Pontibacter aquaedesilientis]MBD1397048.1 signal peptide peptidase SppA [Pontibacter aquaedesilientis]
MLNFLRYVLATIVGLFVFFFLGLLIMVGIVAATASKGDITVAENSVLELKLDKSISEREKESPFGDLSFGFYSFDSGDGLDKIKASIRRAKTDDNVKGIFLNMRFVDAGMGKLEEIRNELIDFKKSGKFIVSYGDMTNEKAYYLSSVADKIYLNPMGALEFNGISSEILFFKGTLEKLDIEPAIFKVGEFKSAVEPFFLDKMSEANREQMNSFLNSMNDYQLRKIAEARGKTYDELKNVSDELLVRDAEDAKKYGLVTDVGYYDEAIDYMKKKVGVEKDKKLQLVSLGKYKKAKDNDQEGSSKNRIAVIYAEGDIVDGEGDDDEIGSMRYAEAIRNARQDKNVKAVVLRINSPGGSALASDVMWREIQETRKVKPVIASMSDVAASGGYYMAMGCDTIVAHPNTITGSIGVFGIVPNFEGFMKNKLGITVDRVGTGKHSDMPTVTRAMTPFEKEIVQREINKIYEVFTQKAADGRGMTQDELKKHASGRVWSGIEAKERNLVDVHGGLEKAIEIAAARVGITGDYRLKELPRRKTFFEEMFGEAGSQVKESAVKAELGQLYPFYQMYKKVENMQGIQARLPYELTIQ